MRKHSRILAILFLIVAGGLVFYATNKDEAEIQAAVEDRVVEAITEREQELKEAYAQREQALADTLAAREQAIRERLAALDSARARVETPVYYRLSAEAIEQVLRRVGLDYESSVDDEGDPNDDGIDVEIAADSGSHPGNHPVVPATTQLGPDPGLLGGRRGRRC